jgi:hypothetical protein
MKFETAVSMPPEPVAEIGIVSSFCVPKTVRSPFCTPCETWKKYGSR